MTIKPTVRSSYTSTVWNSSGRATHSVNSAKFGGPNVRISEGSKVQFTDGTIVWDVARVFDDGSLYLTAQSSGRRLTRRVEPGSKEWKNLTMVDGKRLRTVGQSTQAPPPPHGGGPNRNIRVGETVTLGVSPIRWVVEQVMRDGTLLLQSHNGDKVVSTEVRPKSKLWNSIYAVSG